jgi:hypothetical protein
MRRLVTAGPCRIVGRSRRDEGGENGSLAVILVLFVALIVLSTALVSRVRGDFDNSNFETNLEQARAMAQSGVTDALFQIDQRNSHPGNFCDNPGGTGGCIKGVPSFTGTTTVAYKATFDASADAYTVLSKGTVHGVTYALRAVISANPEVNSALTGSTMTFDGKLNTSVYVTGPNGLPVAGATANISVASGLPPGPQSVMTCNGNTTGNLLFIQYTYSSVSKCSPVTQISATYAPQPPSLTCPSPPNPALQPPTPCVPGSAQSCSAMSGAVSGNNNNGWTITGPATLEPGVYLCYGGLTTSGTINVDYSSTANDGRVEIYVFGPKNNPQSSTDLVLGGTINACEVGTPSATPASNCVSGGTQLVGDPSDLQIYEYGSGSVTVDNLVSANALLWAPNMTMDTHGNADNVVWTGAMILGSILTHGDPATLLLNYDVRLATELQDTGWDITTYLQTSSNFTVP